jgi:hypothetical protein
MVTAVCRRDTTHDSTWPGLLRQRPHDLDEATHTGAPLAAGSTGSTPTPTPTAGSAGEGSICLSGSAGGTRHVPDSAPRRIGPIRPGRPTTGSALAVGGSAPTSASWPRVEIRGTRHFPTVGPRPATRARCPNVPGAGVTCSHRTEDDGIAIAR